MDRVEVRFRGCKGGYNHLEGSAVVRPRDEMKGAGSSLDEKGGAAALMVDLLSCHPPLWSGVPLASRRASGKVGVALWGYGQVLRAITRDRGGVGTAFD